MNEISIEKQIAAINREIRYREFLYPKWVSTGKMTQQKADYQIAVMKAILKTLGNLQKESYENPQETLWKRLKSK